MMTAPQHCATLYHPPVSTSPEFSIDPRALAKLREIRQSQPDGDQLGLVIAITGVNGDEFAYEMAMMLPEHAGSDADDVAGSVESELQSRESEFAESGRAR